MRDTCCCCCCHCHHRWAILIPTTKHQATPNLIPSQHLNTFTPNTQIILIQYSTTSHNPGEGCGEPSTIFSINYNHPNISKFILFYSFISIYLSLLFCILFISSMTNIYHSASLYGSVCGPLASYLLVGLVRPPSIMMMASAYRVSTTFKDPWCCPAQQWYWHDLWYPVPSFFFFISHCLFPSSLVM